VPVLREGRNLPSFPLWFEAQSLDNDAFGIVRSAPLLTRIVSNLTVGALAGRSGGIAVILMLCSVLVAIGQGRGRPYRDADGRRGGTRFPYLFVLTAAVGLVMSNTATTTLVIPIAMISAESLSVQPRPVPMSVCASVAAAFLRRIATAAATNMMVKDPDGYSFNSCGRLRMPLMLWFFVISVFYVPMVWSF
jgi:hypothetical protein